jgi:hypothetical protein
MSQRPRTKRADWKTLPEAVTYVCAANRCEPAEAQEQIRAALADGELRPLRWEDGRPRPFGSTGGLTFPDDTPPLDRHYWTDAEIDWEAGNVLDRSEYSDPPRHRRLLILARALAHRWPLAASAGGAATMPTGAPGRPSKGMHLIRVEFDRRRSTNLCAPLLREEATALAQWFREHFATAQPVKRKTIENSIRAEYRQWAADRKSVVP